MNKQTPLHSTFTLLLLVTILIGCEKGEDGKPGQTGNANVISRTFSVPAWNNSSSIWFVDLSIPELTTSNINTASVQVYWGIASSSNTWIALPYTHVALTNYFMGYVVTTNLVQIQWRYNGSGSGNDPNTVMGEPLLFKVIVIPPAVLKANPDLDIKNYRAVQKALNL